MSRWSEQGGAAPDAYDARWDRLEAAGVDPHGEAALVAAFGPATVLDAGCGTGRVAIELARRGIDVVGVDLDAGLLDHARGKAPELTWRHGDLATIDLGRAFDVAVLAGNVMIYLAPGSEAGVVANLSRQLAPGGRLVAGFQLPAGGLGVDAYDEHARSAGLTREARWSTWARDPWSGRADYAVSVHRRAS